MPQKTHPNVLPQANKVNEFSISAVKSAKNKPSTHKLDDFYPWIEIFHRTV